MSAPNDSLPVGELWHRVVENLKTIQNLVSNPHWDSSRRWKIGELAREAQEAAEQLKKGDL